MKEEPGHSILATSDVVGYMPGTYFPHLRISNIYVTCTFKTPTLFE